MRPTFYLNLQVISYEEDEGTKLLSEQLVCKTIDKIEVYEVYKLIKDLYKPDDSLLVKDDVQPKDRE